MSASEKHYLGIDVGGTKIQASLITESGSVLANSRLDTPRDCDADVTIKTIDDAVRTLLAERNMPMKNIAAAGIAVPGVVQQETGYVVVTPNMNLSGIELGQVMKDQFKIPVAVGNDCNLGTLGECWLGSGRNASSSVGIFVGTGIGAGIVLDNKVLSGAGQAAAEIGHIVSQTPCEDWRHFLDSKRKHKNKELPRCGCGNYGCFESFASRTAMERFIREAIEDGNKSVIKELNGGSLNVIKSGSIAKALKANDKVVTTVVRYASQVIGYACLTVRHLLDPEVIVLGGGVIEACQKFMMPIIDAVVANDQLPTAPSNRRVLVSSLGDHAVVLGAVALARSLSGNNPLQSKARQAVPKYPKLHLLAENVIHIADDPFTEDFFILSDGMVQPRTKLPKKNTDGFRLKDIETATAGGIDLLILASPKADGISLPDKCHEYLFRRGIDYRILPLDDAVKLYNSAAVRRSAVVHF
jgi:glucokinase